MGTYHCGLKVKILFHKRMRNSMIAGQSPEIAELLNHYGLKSIGCLKTTESHYVVKQCIALRCYLIAKALH